MGKINFNAFSSKILHFFRLNCAFFCRNFLASEPSCKKAENYFQVWHLLNPIIAVGWGEWNTFFLGHTHIHKGIHTSIRTHYICLAFYTQVHNSSYTGGLRLQILWDIQTHRFTRGQAGFLFKRPAIGLNKKSINLDMC